MLQAKFQDHRTSSSGAEDFQKFLPYMGVAAILDMSPDFQFFVPESFNTKFGSDRHSSF